MFNRKQRLKLFIDIKKPGTISTPRNNRMRVVSMPKKLPVPVPLRQILPYASVIPLRDLLVRLIVGTTIYEGHDLWEPAYRRRIHQIVATLQRFPDLKCVNIQWLRMERPPYLTEKPPYLTGSLDSEVVCRRTLCRLRVLECFGRSRGLEQVTILGHGVDRQRAKFRALASLMKRPKALDEEDDAAETTFACGCERRVVKLISQVAR